MYIKDVCSYSASVEKKNVRKTFYDSVEIVNKKNIYKYVKMRLWLYVFVISAR